MCCCGVGKTVSVGEVPEGSTPGPVEVTANTSYTLEQRANIHRVTQGELFINT